MKLIFSEQTWDDYLHWQKIDKKLVAKLNGLIKEISRTPFAGTGKPEPLKGDLSGWWSRRINREHRIVYRIVNNDMLIAQCRFHGILLLAAWPSSGMR